MYCILLRRDQRLERTAVGGELHAPVGEHAEVGPHFEQVLAAPYIPARGASSPGSTTARPAKAVIFSPDALAADRLDLAVEIGDDRRGGARRPEPAAPETSFRGSAPPIGHPQGCAPRGCTTRRASASCRRRPSFSGCWPRIPSPRPACPACDSTRATPP